MIVKIEPVEIETKGGVIIIDSVSMSNGGYPFSGSVPSGTYGCWDEHGNYRGSGAPDGRYNVPFIGEFADVFRDLKDGARALGCPTIDWAAKD